MSADMDVLGLATAYRRRVLLFVAHVLWSAGWVPVQQFADDSLAWGLTQFAVGAVNIAILFLLAYNGYRMASWLGSEVPWLWDLGLMVPWPCFCVARSRPYGASGDRPGAWETMKRTISRPSGGIGSPEGRLPHVGQGPEGGRL